jgi:hypothetical protein
MASHAPVGSIQADYVGDETLRSVPFVPLRGGSVYIGYHAKHRHVTPHFSVAGFFPLLAPNNVTKKTNRHITMRITSVWHEKRRWTYYSMLPSSLVHWVLGLVQPLKTKGIFLFQLLFVVFVHASDPLGTCISPRSIWL